MSGVAAAVRGICTSISDEAGHALRFINTVKGVDQSVKILGVCSDFVTALAAHCYANPETLETLGAFTSWVKNARTVTGLLNAPRLIKAVKANVTNTKKLVVGISRGDDVSISRKGDYWTSFNGRAQTYDGALDKMLGVGYEVSKAVAGSAFMFAFGVCRPIMIVTKFYDDMPESVAKVGKAFGIVMLIQNGATLLACSFDAGHELLVYCRSDGASPEQEYAQLKNTFKRHTFVVIEKSGKVITGAFSLSSTQLPPLASASINLVGATFGFINAWINTQ